MKKTRLATYISLLVIGLFSLIYGFIKFIGSYEYYSDEYGTDISFNYDYAIMIIGGLILISYMAYKLYLYINKSQIINYDLEIGTTISLLVSFYTLGIFFKALFKALSKGKEFDYLGNQLYLYLGIGGLIIAIILGVFLVKKYKRLHSNTK